MALTPQQRQQHNRTYYEKNKGRYAENRERHREKIRDIVLAYKVSHPCSCGEDHPACLVFHHRDGSEKEIAVSVAVRRGWGPEKVMAEIAKCDVMCANCHSKLHWSEQNAE